MIVNRYFIVTEDSFGLLKSPKSSQNGAFPREKSQLQKMQHSENVEIAEIVEKNAKNAHCKR